MGNTTTCLSERRRESTSTVIEEHFKSVSYNPITDKSDMAMN